MPDLDDIFSDGGALGQLIRPLDRIGIYTPGGTALYPSTLLMTAVRLLSVKGNVLRVKGLDAIDGTPVLDVKPYMPKFDCLPEATMAEWVTRGQSESTDEHS